MQDKQVFQKTSGPWSKKTKLELIFSNRKRFGTNNLLKKFMP